MPKNRAEVPMTVKVTLAKRINREDWDARNKKSSRIAVGSIVVELSSELAKAIEFGDLELNDLDLDFALKTRGVLPYIVVDHSKTDGRPDCLLIQYSDDQGLGSLGARDENFIACDLPLVPIALLGEE